MLYATCVYTLFATVKLPVKFFKVLSKFCVESGLAESSKYSVRDRETHLNQNNIALFIIRNRKDAKQPRLI